MAKLTAKQELFAQGLMKGLGKREAYKLAGYKVDDSKGRNPIYDVEASRLSRNPNVALRLDEMERAKAVSESVTVQTVTNMLALVFEDGRRFKQFGASATAAMGIAKLHGLLVERVEDVTRKPTRNPDAPLEIEVEHWLTQHRLIGPDASARPDHEPPASGGEGVGPALEPGEPDHVSPNPILPRDQGPGPQSPIGAGPQEGPDLEPDEEAAQLFGKGPLT